MQTTRINSINFWPNIKEQESYPATKSNPNPTCRQSKQDATYDGDQTWERPLPHLPQESPWQCGFNFHDRHCFELCEEGCWPTTSSTGGSLTTKIDNMTDLNFSILLTAMWTYLICLIDEFNQHDQYQQTIPRTHIKCDIIAGGHKGIVARLKSVRDEVTSGNFK